MDAFQRNDQGKMFRLNKKLILTLGTCVSAFVFSASFISCAPASGDLAGAPTPAATSTTSLSGYIVVSNTTFRNVILFDSSFNYVRTLYQASSGDVPWGLANYDSENILASVEGIDRVVRINLNTGSVINFILDANLTGTMRGLARLSGGDIIVSEGTSTIERFLVNADTISTSRVGGSWPVTHGANSTAVWPLSSSNQFLSCSTTTARTVRSNDNAGAQLFTANSAAPVPSLGAGLDVNACVADSSGRVAVLYNNGAATTDALRIYTSSTLATIACTYQNAVLIPNPTTVAVRANGNFLIYDSSALIVTEVSPSCALVGTYSSNYLAGVNQMLVLP
jgi:hypothetical protein